MKNNIRVERAKLKISQSVLAERVQVSLQTIHSIENGKFFPSGVLALKIAHTFNRPVESIFELEPEDWNRH